MFANKKNRIVPPKPQPPTPAQIFEDIKCASNQDVAFHILTTGQHGDDLHFPTNANDPANVYRKVKTYLDVNNKLKTLDETLCENVQSLKDVENEILVLAQEIKGQAKTALAQ